MFWRSDSGQLQSCESPAAAYRRLQVPGADALTGKGVYYGASVSETSSVAGESIHIVGAANSAGQAAIHFATVAKQVTILVRGNALSASMSHYLVERIETTPNIDIRLHTTVEEARGDDHLHEVVLRDSASGELCNEPAGALFIFFIGAARAPTGSTVRSRGARRASSWPEPTS